MSRLVMWNLLTLDGCFEGAKPWDLAFHERVWGEELERLSIEQLRAADRLLFGRVTYEGMAAYWTAPKGEADEVAALMNAIPKVVVSRTLRRADWRNTTLVTGDAVSAVRELKRQGERSTFVFGSANLSETLAAAGLFDEYRLALVPVVLGNGRQLFGRGLAGARLRLIDSRPLSNGGVILRYEPAAAAAPSEA